MDDYNRDNPLLPQGFNPAMAGFNPLMTLPQRQQSPAIAGLTADVQSPAGQLVLNRIASGESPDYNTIYSPAGGPLQKFTNYADHPRQRQVITEGPHKGETSDAAGRYQFLGSTWARQKKKLGLTDFAPLNQDIGALDLAKTTYAHATGRDLLADASAGKVNWQALQGQWPSLGKAGGVKPGAQEATHAGQSDGSTGAVPPQMALAMMAALAPQHSFAPVDYDPFKVEPKVPGTV